MTAYKPTSWNQTAIAWSKFLPKTQDFPQKSLNITQHSNSQNKLQIYKSATSRNQNKNYSFLMTKALAKTGVQHLTNMLLRYSQNIKC